MSRRYGTAEPQIEATGRPPGFAWRALAGVAFAACLMAFLWQWLVAGRPIGGGLLVAPVLLVLTAPAFVRAARTERSFDLAGLMATGLALRFVGAYFRFTNAVDAHVYDRVGTELAESFRALRFDVDTGRPLPGTGGLRYLAGLVSVPFGTDQFAKFLVFTWLGFWGCVLLYRAFVTAMPDGDRRRYALLVFLWPSLAFWPSSIGKEAWMLFTLGIAMLGVARVLTRERGGYLLLIAGLAGGTLVRPHVMMLVVVAFTVGLLVRRQNLASSKLVTPSSVGKVAGLVCILVVGSLIATRTEQLFDLDDLGTSSVETTREHVEEQTGQGGSEYEPSNPRRPDGYAVAAVTILFRPFPQEADTGEQLLTALEGLVLAGLFLGSLRRFRALPGYLLRSPYAVSALAFLLMFVYAFAAIGNFGILARQRTQALPIAFVLLCLPAVARAVQRKHPSQVRRSA